MICIEYVLANHWTPLQNTVNITQMYRVNSFTPRVPSASLMSVAPLLPGADENEYSSFHQGLHSAVRKWQLGIFSLPMWPVCLDRLVKYFYEFNIVSDFTKRDVIITPFNVSLVHTEIQELKQLMRTDYCTMPCQHCQNNINLLSEYNMKTTKQTIWKDYYYVLFTRCESSLVVLKRSELS